MRKLRQLVIVFAGLIGTSVGSADEPVRESIRVDVIPAVNGQQPYARVEIGEQTAGQRSHYRLFMVNRTGADLRIVRISPTCSCTELKTPAESTVPPLGEIAVDFSIDVGLDADPRRTYDVKFDADGAVQSIMVVLVTRISNALNFQPFSNVFRVASGSRAASSQSANFRIPISFSLPVRSDTIEVVPDDNLAFIRWELREAEAGWNVIGTSLYSEIPPTVITGRLKLGVKGSDGKLQIRAERILTIMNASSVELSPERVLLSDEADKGKRWKGRGFLRLDHAQFSEQNLENMIVYFDALKSGYLVKIEHGKASSNLYRLTYVVEPRDKEAMPEHSDSLFGVTKVVIGDETFEEQVELRF